MEIFRVWVIILIYTQTVFLSLISTNSLKREMSNLFRNPNNNNIEGSIFTQKGKKIQLTQDGNIIICGIDSLEDDYYGCQSSYEVHLYKTYETSKNEKRKPVSVAATRGSSVKKKQDTVPKSSLIAALSPMAKPTVKMTNNSSKSQTDLFGPRASDKLFDYFDTIIYHSRSLFKDTSSSTTPIYATSAETRYPYKPSSDTALASIVGNLIKSQSRITSIPRVTTLIPKLTVKMAHHVSTLKADLFSPKAADKQLDYLSAALGQFEYLDTAGPSRSLFKNTKCSSTTSIFATSAETRSPYKPSNLIKQQSRIISRTTTPSTKTKPTIMLAHYVSERQDELFSSRTANILFDFPYTVSPSRSIFKRFKSSMTPIFATSAGTSNPVRTNSKTTSTNNAGNLVKLKSSISPILRTLAAKSNTPLKTLAGGPSQKLSTRSIVWRADEQPAIKHLFNY